MKVREPRATAHSQERHEGSKGLVEANVRPPLDGHQVSKPNMAQLVQSTHTEPKALGERGIFRKNKIFIKGDRRCRRRIRMNVLQLIALNCPSRETANALRSAEIVLWHKDLIVLVERERAPKEVFIEGDSTLHDIKHLLMIDLAN